mgnify:CR=1 FL=1|jgi:serine kinase of HPr protein (carbohydrate metabolism regulator)
MVNMDEEEYDRFNTFGVYKMIQDIHDEEYTSPLKLLKNKQDVKKNS